MAKFDCIFKGDEDNKRPRLQQSLHSELILSKEQLYDMFQQILGVKKFEHQLLYNALQVVNQKKYTDMLLCSLKEISFLLSFFLSIFLCPFFPLF